MALDEGDETLKLTTFDGDTHMQYSSKKHMVDYYCKGGDKLITTLIIKILMMRKI